MRVALLADVHANLHALRAVLDDVAPMEPDAIVVAGDLVGYGPAPNACLEALVEAGADSVAGNHDLGALGQIAPARFSSLAQHAAEVTVTELGRDSLDHLAALPRRRRIGSIHVAHGSLDDPEEYVTRRRRARELLADVAAEDPACSVLVLGHTHRAWVVPSRTGPALVNPGSVGQSRCREVEPRARYAVVDTASAEVRLRTVRYDVRGASEDLARLGLPSRCLHAPPARTRPVRAAGYRTLRAVGLTPPRRRARW